MSHTKLQLTYLASILEVIAYTNAYIKVFPNGTLKLDLLNFHVVGPYTYIINNHNIIIHYLDHRDLANQT